MNPVRILFVSGGSLDYGGIASWMLSYASRFHRDLFEVDFLVHGMEKGAREAEALSLGATVYHVPYRRQSPLINRKRMEEAIGAGYDVVHAHMDGMNAYPLTIAKRLGVPVRISHSHNTDFLTGNPVKRILHEQARKQIPASATHLLACSEVAGRFLYGDKRYESGKVKLVRNAIDVEAFRFDAQQREKIRTELGVGDRFLIGNIGRFDVRQKNQLFLLDAFAEAKKKRPELMLALVGDGNDRPQIEERIRNLGIKKDVILTGFRKDVQAIYNAFDLFVLPSCFEGLGIVLIEAQANGLPCLASETVPRETQLSNCQYLPLEDTHVWADAFILAKPSENRILPEQAIQEHGYDITTEAKLLEQFYCEAVRHK